MTSLKRTSTINNTNFSYMHHDYRICDLVLLPSNKILEWFHSSSQNNNNFQNYFPEHFFRQM